MEQERIAWVAVAVVLVGIAFASSKTFKMERFSTFTNFKAMAVIINLDKNKERLLRILTEYSTSDLAGTIPVRRFAAIDATNIDISRYVTEQTVNQIQKTATTGYRIRHHEMTLGAVGCFLSHISVMRMLLQDDNHDTFFILEDDALIPPKIYADIGNTIRTAPLGWDVLVLGYHYATYDADKYDPFFRLLTFWGMHAIIINKVGAQKIVEEYEANKINMQIDSMLGRMIKAGKINVFAPKKMLVMPGDFGSDIQVHVRHVDGVDPYSLE